MRFVAKVGNYYGIAKYFAEKIWSIRFFFVPLQPQIRKDP